jgi:outer membrane receptor protein involved in Fe transport
LARTIGAAVSIGLQLEAEFSQNEVQLVGAARFRFAFWGPEAKHPDLAFMDFEFVGVGNRRSLAKARSTILRTRSTANVGYFQTFNRLNVRLDGHADYTVADYTALSAGTSNQYDQYFTFRAGVQYLPTPNVYVGPTYQFIHRTSKQFNADYD